jgi:hypothetical protein
LDVLADLVVVVVVMTPAAPLQAAPELLDKDLLEAKELVLALMQVVVVALERLEKILLLVLGAEMVVLDYNLVLAELQHSMQVVVVVVVMEQLEQVV